MINYIMYYEILHNNVVSGGCLYNISVKGQLQTGY